MFDWENMRYFLTVGRFGTLSGAARALEVDHATVSRRVSALEEQLNIRLVERLPRACPLTAAGQHVFDLAQTMEESAYAVERFVVASNSPLTGNVTLSAPPVLVANFLARQLADFKLAHPRVHLHISAQPRQVSLGRREADIVLRLVRPREATSVARKLGRLSFDLYASKNYRMLHDASAWEFIVYEPDSSDVPQHKWLMDIVKDRTIACEIGDINGHLAAAQAGAGVACLPRFLADQDPTLQRVPHEAPPFSRDIWMAVHRDLRRSPHIRAVMEFLLKVVSEKFDVASGS
ncbi:LysR family transcriptional regulator [Paraburkholderia sp. DHOC27]|uniref:LysR family transcriptional regulator n=1 Tax=Paraburkholderia sp. DHOC27 TaxID=2303330 RepID=UPI000E3C6A77|nr:LysR family transcriptional regulator [Paraburkholderia sp. DHOC27]RFU49081.1 LysR family transcriptional regulator [Paraburkholderia sp. DHOC27]